LVCCNSLVKDRLVRLGDRLVHFVKDRLVRLEDRLVRLENGKI
jgi:hypothetical protein